MEERLRPCRHAAAAPLHALFRQAARHRAERCFPAAELEDWAGPPDLPETRADRHAVNITLVAEDDGQITGCMMMHPHGHPDMAFVRPDRRRSPTAALRYDAMLAEGRARRLPRMAVPASRPIERFLSKRGWRAAPEPAAERGEIPRNRPWCWTLRRDAPSTPLPPGRPGLPVAAACHRQHPAPFLNRARRFFLSQISRARLSCAPSVQAPMVAGGSAPGALGQGDRP